MIYLVLYRPKFVFNLYPPTEILPYWHSSGLKERLFIWLYLFKNTRAHPTNTGSSSQAGAYKTQQRNTQTATLLKIFF